MTSLVKRGDVFWANLDPTVGVEIKKTRPGGVVSNNVMKQRGQLGMVVPLFTT